jgi:ATP/ADP translocase
MMKVDIVVMVVVILLLYYHYHQRRLLEEENCSFAFVKDQKQDEKVMMIVEVELLILQSLYIFYFDQNGSIKLSKR